MLATETVAKSRKKERRNKHKKGKNKFIVKFTSQRKAEELYLGKDRSQESAQFEGLGGGHQGQSYYRTLGIKPL